ncbi:HAMP domain-containing protein [Deinococcus radiomollis]|uniref:HAMP domain-containing protein n=1 Tax=Deinococcus radiomollis TaxID=468916 RepID=UPI003891F28C
MKYTVVIRQPVPEAALAELGRELSQQFELTADQASKLASRRSGRLMKPTSRKRAERLLQVFQSVGAQVTLEEVREDTTLLKDPFAHERPGLVGPASMPAGLPPTAAPSVSSAYTGASYTESDSLPGRAAAVPAYQAAYDASPYGTGPLMTSGGSAVGASLHDWNGADVATLPVPPVSAPPVSAPYLEDHPSFPPFGQTGVGTASNHGHLDALLPSDPLEPAPAFVQRDAEMVTPEHVQSGVPEMNLGGLLTPVAASAGVAVPASADVLPAAVTPAAVIPTDVVVADDAWADFTGSLNSGAAPAAAVDAPASSVMAVDPSLDPVRSSRRSSLSRRVLVSTLVPLGLFTLVTLGFLVYELPRAQRQLITQNAQAVAVAVGSNLDVTDQNTVYAQLDALIKRSSVGFVQVNLPDGTTFFRSKNAYTDGPLSEQIAAWVQSHPANSTFVQSGSAADSYKYQLSLLEQVGAGDSDQAKSLRSSVADPANQASSTTTYLLSSINVTQNAQAERVVAEGIKSGSGTPLYSIVVGVPGDAAFALLRNTLLLVLGVALLAFVLAALLAARTARLVVQPIERLVRAADAISMGDLDRPVTVERNDEVGDLAQALERMRLSLEAAMERLRRRRKGV